MSELPLFCMPASPGVSVSPGHESSKVSIADRLLLIDVRACDREGDMQTTNGDEPNAIGTIDFQLTKAIHRDCCLTLTEAIAFCSLSQFPAVLSALVDRKCSNESLLFAARLQDHPKLSPLVFQNNF
eukprot:2118809-Amphidinium_carterae.1